MKPRYDVKAWEERVLAKDEGERVPCDRVPATLLVTLLVTLRIPRRPYP